MSTPERHTLVKARRLLRLRELHEDAARRACTEQRARCAEAERTVEARKQEFARCQAACAALAKDMNDASVGRMPALIQMAQARREVLDDLAERCEYALIDDEDALRQAHEALREAEQALSRAAMRVRGAGLLVERVARRCAQQREGREEREADERPVLAHAFPRDMNDINGMNAR